MIQQLTWQATDLLKAAEMGDEPVVQATIVAALYSDRPLQ